MMSSRMNLNSTWAMRNISYASTPKKTIHSISVNVSSRKNNALAFRITQRNFRTNNGVSSFQLRRQHFESFHSMTVMSSPLRHNYLRMGNRNGNMSLRRRRHWPASTPASLKGTGRSETALMTRNFQTITASSGASAQVGFRRKVWHEISNRPIEFLSVPCVAAFVGILTNWMGVKMLFYPVEYMGLDFKRWEKTPYGLFGWQGVVPTKTDVMAKRLVRIITEKLLSLDEAFDRLDPNELGRLLLPGIEDSVDAALVGPDGSSGSWYAWGVKQILYLLMPHLVTSLKQEIEQVLDLETVVLTAFLRDKATLVDLFQKVGRVELEFLVNSGFGLGFLLGLGQMVFWAAHPAAWTLPAAGALVGYVTNWIAIHMLFEPAEPVEILGLFEVQGMFESRQIEVSDEFGDFLQKRVLTASELLRNMAMGGEDGELFKFLRRHLPYPIPSEILLAAVNGISKIADDPVKYADVHKYVNERLDIRETLSRRLKKLSATEFEDLLHPVFQEDEITLIATGGVLGLAAGGLQTQLGWGGINAVPRAIGTIIFTMVCSMLFYFEQEYKLEQDEPLASTERPELRKRKTVVRRPTLKTPPNRPSP